MSYLTLTFLGILLVAQSPLPSSVNAQKFNTKNKLYKGTVAAFVNFATQWGKRYGKVLDRVIEDLKAEGKENAGGIEHLKEIAELSKHLRAGSDDETLRNIMNFDGNEADLKEIIDSFADPEHVVTLAYKDGKDTVQEFYITMLKFFDAFGKALEEFTRDMSDKEKAEHKEFLEWFKKYEVAKQNKNIIEQSRLFLDFFKFFNPDL
uniref:Gmfb8e n=1 Tax=Glossina morsitans morsitans TaxID=37546 RepID=D3TRR4_GLOMM